MALPLSYYCSIMQLNGWIIDRLMPLPAHIVITLLISTTPPLLFSLFLSPPPLCSSPGSSPSLSSISSGIRSLETLCLQVTDLFPGLRRMQSVLPEHGCLLVSPGNYWQNQRELFDSDPDPLKTIQKHEPKGLHTSATLRGRDEEDS